MKAIIEANLFWRCPNCGDTWSMDKIKGTFNDTPECEACGDTAQFTMSFESIEELKTSLPEPDDERIIYYKGKRKK